MTDPEQIFNAAVRHHVADRLAEAEPLYRQVLALAPDEVSVLNNLGVVLHRLGRNDEAARLPVRDEK